MDPEQAEEEPKRISWAVCWVWGQCIPCDSNSTERGKNTASKKSTGFVDFRGSRWRVAYPPRPKPGKGLTSMPWAGRPDTPAFDGTWVRPVSRCSSLLYRQKQADGGTALRASAWPRPLDNRKKYQGLMAQRSRADYSLTRISEGCPPYASTPKVLTHSPDATPPSPFAGWRRGLRPAGDLGVARHEVAARGGAEALPRGHARRRRRDCPGAEHNPT